MTSPQTQSLMSIATDSSKSVHERIRMIKGKDNVINSVEEARAILAISQEDVTWLENKNELPLEKMDANYFIKYGGRNLRDDLVDAYNYCMKQGKQLCTTIYNYFTSSDTPEAAQKQ